MSLIEFLGPAYMVADAKNGTRHINMEDMEEGLMADPIRE